MKKDNCFSWYCRLWTVMLKTVRTCIWSKGHKTNMVYLKGNQSQIFELTSMENRNSSTISMLDDLKVEKSNITPKHWFRKKKNNLHFMRCISMEAIITCKFSWDNWLRNSGGSNRFPLSFSWNLDAAPSSMGGTIWPEIYEYIPPSTKEIYFIHNLKNGTIEHRKVV